jgi:hypothetical protein
MNFAEIKKEKWIYGSIVRDFWILYFPPLLVILYFTLFRSTDEESWHRLLLGLLALVIIDNGHVYTTFWRTYFNPNEFHRRQIYYWVPLAIFLGCVLFSKLNFQRFWTFVVYAALYHNIRQLYGYFKWYGQINKYYDRVFDYLLYAFCYFPVLIFHTDKPRVTKGYFADDIYNFENVAANKMIWTLYLLTIGGFFAYLFWLKQKKRFPPVGQILFLGLSALIYNRAFIPSLTRTEMMEIVAVPHGVAYILSVAFIAVKIQAEEEKWQASGLFSRALLLSYFKKLKPKTLFTWVILSSALFGVGDYIVDDFYLDISNPEAGMLNTILSAIWITPLLSHYYFDAVIWRHNHPEFKFIIKA